MSTLLPRRLAPAVVDALSAFRGVVVAGPRQAGKTTLVRELVGESATYRTLDDQTTRDAADRDPEGLVATDGLLVLDEFQRGGDPLLLAIKARLDRSDARGQVLLTGSANFLASRRLTETLAGRVGIIDLLPLSQGEIRGTADGFVGALRTGGRGVTGLSPLVLPMADLAAAMVRGGFPEVVRHVPGGAESRWFDAYVRTVVERETHSVAALTDLDALRRSLTALAALTGREVNLSALASRLGVTRATLSGHLQVLEALFLVTRLPAWTPEAAGRITKSPKVHLVDTGLVAALHGWSVDRVLDPTVAPVGQLWETFVATELRKQCTWLPSPPRLFHCRDKGGRHEVDVVLEWPDGAVAGVEVKRSRSVRGVDAAGLRWLRDRARGRLAVGVVLYGGADVVKLDRDIWALPIGALWA